MLAYPLASVALLLAAQGADAVTDPKAREFMRAMKAGARKNDRKARKLSGADRKEFMDTVYSNSKKGASLRKKIMEKAKPQEGGRKLEDSSSYVYNGQKSNGYNKDADDYFAANGDWENEFGFDVTQYSLSYHRCAAVTQYDDEIAAQEDTTDVFATKQFAVFRFCPESTCMGAFAIDYEAEWQARQQQQNGQAQDEGKYSNRYGEDDPNCERYNANGECAKWNYLGARGTGCSSNYGEYMIELKDYLDLMLEFQGERFETYCEYCEECMWEVYQQWLKKGGHRKLSYDEFKESEEVQRELGGNVNGGQQDGYFYNACPEYDTCAEYKNTCNGDVNGGLANYFECTEVESANGRVAYIGPHCAEDGFTVTLGVYSDEGCNNYIGNGVNIANFIGEDLDLEEDDLKSYYNSMNGQLDLLEFSNEDDVCIPCRKGDMPYEDSDYEPQTDDQQWVQINYGETEITDICESLYMASARCDKHFRSYNARTQRAKYADAYAEAVAQEDLSCDFIDSVIMGNYNEMGLLNLKDYQIDDSPEWLQKNIYSQQYGHYITEVTPLQIFGLIASIAACAILAVYSTSLHRSVSKRGPWRPRRGVNSTAPSGQAEDVTRQNSGIVLGRSQSNVSYYMT